MPQNEMVLVEVRDETRGVVDVRRLNRSKLAKVKGDNERGVINMLNMANINQEKTVNYGKDETYTLCYMTDERLREIAGKNNIGIESILSPNMGRDDKDKVEGDVSADETKETLAVNVMNAVFNTEFVISVVCEVCSGWTGIFNGKIPYVCDDKNKALFFRTFGNRALFVYRKCRDERLFMGGTIEEDIKN